MGLFTVSITVYGGTVDEYRHQTGQSWNVELFVLIKLFGWLPKAKPFNNQPLFVCAQCTGECTFRIGFQCFLTDTNIDFPIFLFRYR